MIFEQKKYKNIIRYGKSGNEVSAIGDIVIWEKIDGANAAFSRVDDEIKTFSHRTELTGEGGLSGFRKWVLDNIDVKKLKEGFIYFGEWTCRHKIDYGENEKKFYFFDVYNLETQLYLDIEAIRDEAKNIGLELAPIFYEGEFISEEHLQSFVGKSNLAVNGVGEGVVVKNYKYLDRNGKQTFTKIVSKHFQEISGHRIKDKKSAPDIITQFIDKTVTQARIEKFLYKLVDDGSLKEDFAIEDMGIILKLLGSSIFDDIMKEEQDELMKLVKSRFGKNVPNKIRETLLKMGRG